MGWLNYYSVNDPFGYPLKPLNDDYDDERLLTDLRPLASAPVKDAAQSRR